MIKENWDCLNIKGKVFLVTDENVAKLYLDDFDSLPRHILPSGEAAKNMENIVKILEAMAGVGLDRKSTVIALGGGVVTDMAGFAASIYMRGINWIALPTTLMGMVDAAHGGKTGVDFLGGKNLVGTFHKPSLVYCNISTLSTLPPEDFISGLAEVIKYGIIKDEPLLDYLGDNQNTILSRNHNALTHIIQRSINIKTDIVNQDEKEAGLRQILNFGHTFGHAIESGLNFTKPHGHCVALGMTCALDYSVRNLSLNQAQADRAIKIMEGFGLPTTLRHAPELPANKIYNLMLKDKKAINQNLTLITTNKLGTAQITTKPTKPQVIKAIERIL
ncbi:MAG: 3-dehydroquinate synthase [Defluviitaleaceae bacterium]|nr:3-dehydroquinate synthase [Defluviitaleaceae bacterium]